MTAGHAMLPNLDALSEDPCFCLDVGSGVWLMDDHRWALKVWESQGRRTQYSLVHADFHWDAGYDFKAGSPEEQQLLAASPDAIAAMVELGKWIRLDSFIAPALLRRTVRDVHFYCLQGDVETSAFDDAFLRSCGARQFVYDSAQSLASARIAQPFLFDLCLDLFNRSDMWCEGDLWDDAAVSAFLHTMRSIIVGAELVTVSLSFNYSGDWNDTRHLAKLVLPTLLDFRS